MAALKRASTRVPLRCPGGEEDTLLGGHGRRKDAEEMERRPDRVSTEMGALTQKRKVRDRDISKRVGQHPQGADSKKYNPCGGQRCRGTAFPRLKDQEGPYLHILFVQGGISHYRTKVNGA